jgi:hypothetical protein
MKLKKSEILLGVNAIREIEIDSLGGSISIRPLTQTESAMVSEMALDGMTGAEISAIVAMSKGGKSEIDSDILKKAIANERKSALLALRLGLSCDGETWTDEDVEKLPSDVATKLTSEILRFSGVNQEGAADAAKFRIDD